MGNIALRVSNLGKQYFIGAKKEKSLSLTDSLTDAFKHPFRRTKGRVRQGGESGDGKPFWALRDVSFEVRHGEALGIIGRNGSGKSTLLKLISNVLDPTTGQVELYGRVGSLLEIGMGFHPELTGRENIYLSGAIMGMKKVEIDRKLDEIIDFSEIEEFIDTAVKRYSSGMYVRLAFSVAAQLDPEILVLDEVLAVGDTLFQKKSLQKMHQIAREGRTVLFVSHGMGSVQQFCETGILLSDGRVVAKGSANDVVDQYMEIVDENLRDSVSVERPDDIPRLIARLPADPVFRLENVSILQDGRSTLDVINANPVEIRIDYEVLEETPGLFVFFRLVNYRGTLLFESLHNGDSEPLPTVCPGLYASIAVIPGNLLAPVPHEIFIGAAIFGLRGCLPEMIRIPLNVASGGRVNRAYPQRKLHGEMAPLIEWKTCCNETDVVHGQLSPQLAFLAERVWSDQIQAPGNDFFRIRSMRVRNSGGEISARIDDKEPFEIEIEYWNLQEGTQSGTSLIFSTLVGEVILGSLNNRDSRWHGYPKPRGLFRSVCSVPSHFFAPGYLKVSGLIWRYGYLDPIQVDDILIIYIEETQGSARGDFLGYMAGPVRPIFPWRTDKLG